MPKSFLTIILCLLALSACKKTFTMEINIYGVKGQNGEPLQGGTAQLRFGNNQPTAPAPVDEKGHATFKGIDAAWEHDSIKLVYAPPSALPYRVTEQTAYTAAERKKIDFNVDFPPPTTFVEWSLRDKDGNGIVGATITIEHMYSVQTGNNGYFQINAPKMAGEKCFFHIEKDGKVLLDRELVVFPEYQRLVVDL